MSDALEITRPAENLPAPSVGNVLEAIARAAGDRNVDVIKMRELLDMQERILAIMAKREATEEKKVMLAKMPRITKRGEILITERAKGANPATPSGTRRVIQRTKYGKYEDIDEVIRPILAEHGFVLTHTTAPNPAGGLIVTGILTHSGQYGVHEETSTIPLPMETSGSKNNVQGIGSSQSYGRRYTATALLNLIFEGEDDDGNGGEKPPELLSDEQVAELSQMLTDAGARLDLFLEAFEIETLGDLPVDRLEEAKTRIRTYKANKTRRHSTTQEEGSR